MSRGDQSGPYGEGPMTGRAMGYCAGYDRPGFSHGPGMGMGRGAGYGPGMGPGRGLRRGGRGPGFGASPYGGRGMAWGHGPAASNSFASSFASKENRKKVLQEQAEALEEQLNFLKREIEAIGEEKEEQ